MLSYYLAIDCTFFFVRIYCDITSIAVDPQMTKSLHKTVCFVLCIVYSLYYTNRGSVLGEK